MLNPKVTLKNSDESKDFLDEFLEELSGKIDATTYPVPKVFSPDGESIFIEIEVPVFSIDFIPKNK